MKETSLDECSQDGNAAGGSLPERPAEPPDPEREQKSLVLNQCFAGSYEEFMSAARTWLGRSLRRQLGAKEFESQARTAVHTAYLRVSQPDKLDEFDPAQGDPRKWVFTFIYTVVREF